MTRTIRRFGFLVMAVGLTSALSGPAAAQSCWNYMDCGVPFPGNPCPAAANHCALGPIGFVCKINNNTCPSPCKGGVSCNRCPRSGEPICLSTGNTYIEQTDIRIPGLGGGLTLVRTWNSVWPSTQSALQIGLFGPNWRSTYEEKVFVDSDYYVKYARSDGSFWAFGYSGTSGGNNVYTTVGPMNESATLTEGSSYWTLTFLNGEKRHFDNVSGNLTAIIDRNGNTTQIAYDAQGRLSTVTDPASRTLTFGYQNSSSLLVISVTASVGPSLSYLYDAQNRLSKVTKPDLTIITFAYDANSFISSVTDNEGKVLESHTYGTTGRGLTGSKAGGVEQVTVSYPNE